MKKFEVENHEYSLLPEGEWELAWSDEFDGTELDREKWDYRTSMMQRKHPGWTDKGVTLDGNSNAVFTLMMEDGKPVSSQLQTGYNFMDQPLEKTTFEAEDIQWTIGKLHESKYLHSYGYYECRCKFQQKGGWWSAFWLQSPIIGASMDPEESGVEIDIMECFNPGQVARHNVFTGGYGLDMKHSVYGEMGKETWLDETEFHRFGLLWDETGYTFYVDGKVDGRITDKLTAKSAFILISTEPKGYRSPGHQPTKEAIENVGDTFIVDYVRVFDKVEKQIIKLEVLYYGKIN